jgi:hypothetical protein
LTNSELAYFCLVDLADSGGFEVSISKKQPFSHFCLHFGGFLFYQLIKSNVLQNIVSIEKYFSFATPEIRPNPP